MKKAKFTDEQIAFVLKQVELGTPVEEVCRKVGVSEQTFYRWKSKFRWTNFWGTLSISDNISAPGPAQWGQICHRKFHLIGESYSIFSSYG